jgi:hypothetical protein
MNPRRSRRTRASLPYLHVSIATLVVGAMLSLAQGQEAPQYETLPLYKVNNKSLTSMGQLRTFVGTENDDVLKMLDAGPNDAAAFDKFFNEIIFPMFTHQEAFKDPTPAQRNTPARMRQQFRKDYVAKARSTAAKDRLMDLTLQKMQQIAGGNFHPWVRANAVFMIGELNDGEPGPPLKKAYPILFTWATDPKMPDVVRISAFRDLARHAITPNAMVAEERPKLVAAMLVIAKQHTATPEQSLDGHEWIMRRSIDILAALGEPGDKNVVFDELLKIVDDEAAPRPARADAAAALAKIRFTPPKEFDVEGYAKSLGKLAVAAYKAELAEATSNRQPIAAARLKQQLAEIRKGLASADGKGTATIFTTDVLKKFAVDIITQLDAMIKACDTPLDFDGQQKALSDPNYVPNVPYDLQQTIAKAISTTGAALEAVLQAGAGGNVPPAGGPTDGIPGVDPPPAGGAVKPAPVVAPKKAAGRPG